MKNIGDLKVLAPDELKNLLILPADKKRNYLIAGYVDYDNQHIMCFRGSGTSFIIPFSTFKPSGNGVKPNFDELEFIDYGQTIKLGEYEAAVDAILYELDESYKHEVDDDPNTWEGQQNALGNRKKISN